MCGVVFFNDYKAACLSLIKNEQISSVIANTAQVEISRFPLPSLEIKSLKYNDIIELDKIRITFTPLSLLRFKPQVSKVHIPVVKVYVKDNVLDSIDYNKIGYLLNEYGIGVLTNISYLYILDAKGNSKMVLKNILLKPNNELEGSVDKLGKFHGSLAVNRSEFKAELISENYNLYLAGKCTQSSITSHGKLKINNLVESLTKMSPDLEQNFKPDQFEPIDINFDLNLTNKLIELKNLSVNSNIISGTGDVSVDLYNKVINNIDLNFSKIELPASIQNTGILFYNKYKLTKKIDFIDIMKSININIEELTLGKEKQLSNVKFVGYRDPIGFLIKDFSGLINKDGQFKVDGQLTQNPYRSLFDGKIYLKHENLSQFLVDTGFTIGKIKKPLPFVLTSKLKSTIIDTYLHNLKLKAENLELSGELSSKFVGLTPRIYANLNFSTLNLDTGEYPVITDVEHFIQSLFQNTNDDQYLNKFIPIRTIPYIGDFVITFNDLIFKDAKFDKLSFSLLTAPSQININNLSIIKDANNISLNIGLDVNSLKPKVDIKIDDGTLHTDLLTPTMLINLRNFLLKNYNMNKVILNIEGKLSRLYQKGLELQDIQLQAQNNNTLLNIINLQAKTLLGDIKAEGSLLLEPFTLNFVYGLNSIDITSLCNFIPKELLDNTGVMSMSGMLTTNGDTVEKLLYNLYSRSSFIVKDAKISNFSIDDFVDNFYSLSYNTANLPTDLQLALLTGQTNIEMLKGDLELSQGLLNLKQVSLKTKETNASISAAINLYNFALDINALFLLQPPNQTRTVKGFLSKPVELNIHVLGNIFVPQKTIDVDKFIQLLNSQGDKN